MEEDKIDRIAVPISHAGRIIGCGRSKIYQLIKEKELPKVKIGNRSVVPVEALHKLIARKVKEQG